MFDGVLHDFCFVFTFFVWGPCMAINVSVQYNSGLLPDIILLTQCYYHWGTRLNVMKRFCIYLQPLIPLTMVNVLTFPPPNRGMLIRTRRVLIFRETQTRGPIVASSRMYNLDMPLS